LLYASPGSLHTLLFPLVPPNYTAVSSIKITFFQSSKVQCSRSLHQSYLSFLLNLFRPGLTVNLHWEYLACVRIFHIVRGATSCPRFLTSLASVPQENPLVVKFWSTTFRTHLIASSDTAGLLERGWLSTWATSKGISSFSRYPRSLATAAKA